MTGAVTSSRGPCSAGSAVKRRASRWLAVFVLAPLLLTCLPPAQAPAYAVAGACVPAASPPCSSASGERVDAPARQDDVGVESGADLSAPLRPVTLTVEDLSSDGPLDARAWFCHA